MTSRRNIRPEPRFDEEQCYCSFTTDSDIKKISNRLATNNVLPRISEYFIFRDRRLGKGGIFFYLKINASPFPDPDLPDLNIIEFVRTITLSSKVEKKNPSFKEALDAYRSIGVCAEYIATDGFSGDIKKSSRLPIKPGERDIYYGPESFAPRTQKKRSKNALNSSQMSAVDICIPVMNMEEHAIVEVSTLCQSESNHTPVAAASSDRRSITPPRSMYDRPMTAPTTTLLNKRIVLGDFDRTNEELKKKVKVETQSKETPENDGQDDSYNDVSNNNYTGQRANDTEGETLYEGPLESSLRKKDKKKATTGSTKVRCYFDTPDNMSDNLAENKPPTKMDPEHGNSSFENVSEIDSTQPISASTEYVKKMMARIDFLEKREFDVQSLLEENNKTKTCLTNLQESLDRLRENKYTDKDLQMQIRLSNAVLTSAHQRHIEDLENAYTEQQSKLFTQIRELEDTVKKSRTEASEFENIKVKMMEDFERERNLMKRQYEIDILNMANSHETTTRRLQESNFHMNEEIRQKNKQLEKLTQSQASWDKDRQYYINTLAAKTAEIKHLENSLNASNVLRDQGAPIGHINQYTNGQTDANVQELRTRLADSAATIDILENKMRELDTIKDNFINYIMAQYHIYVREYSRFPNRIHGFLELVAVLLGVDIYASDKTPLFKAVIQNHKLAHPDKVVMAPFHPLRSRFADLHHVFVFTKKVLSKTIPPETN